MTQAIDQQQTSQPVLRMPKRIVTLDLPEPYDVYTVRAWVNFPQSLSTDLRSGDEARTAAAVNRLIVEHNLTDEDGNPYPPAGDAAFFEALPNDLAAMILQTLFANVGKLPTR